MSTNNRVRIPPYLMRELARLGFTSTEGISLLVSSLLMMWLHGNMEIPQTAIKAAVSGGGDTSEADAALEGLFD